MIKSPPKNVADLSRGRTHDLLVSSRTRIQLSHRGWHTDGQTNVKTVYPTTKFAGGIITKHSYK